MIQFESYVVDKIVDYLESEGNNMNMNMRVIYFAKRAVGEWHVNYVEVINLANKIVFQELPFGSLKHSKNRHTIEINTKFEKKKFIEFETIIGEPHHNDIENYCSES